MCVIQPCEKPTEAGVWWRDDTQWCLYGAAHQATIRSAITNGLTSVDLGKIVSVVHPLGARYAANIMTMEQIAVSSGQRRDIIIVDNKLVSAPAAPLQLPSPPMVVLSAYNFVGQAVQRAAPPRGNFHTRVHYRDSSGELQEYDKDIAMALLKEMAQGLRTTVLQDVQSSRHMLFDLLTMKQYFCWYDSKGKLVASDDESVDVVVEIPWNTSIMTSITKQADMILRKKILEMVIERRRSDKMLDAMLPARAHPRKIMRRSVCITRPGDAPYDEFIDSLNTVIERVPNGLEKLVKETALEDGSILQIAFRPAKLDKKCEYITYWKSMLAPIAAEHAVVYGTAVQLRILMYLVIIPGLSRNWVGKSAGNRCAEYIEIHKPEHRLRLGEVTVT